MSGKIINLLDAMVSMYSDSYGKFARHLLNTEMLLFEDFNQMVALLELYRES